MGRENHTRVRNLRMGPLWDEALAVARGRGETLTAVIERALRNYVRRHETTSGENSSG